MATEDDERRHNVNEYLVDSDAAGVALSQLRSADESSVMVCPHGHVHVVLDGVQISLSPDDAESWVKILYDAAQEARQVGGGDE